jgi:Tfp pilus assembly protein PilN
MAAAKVTQARSKRLATVFFVFLGLFILGMLYWAMASASNKERAFIVMFLGAVGAVIPAYLNTMHLLITWRRYQEDVATLNKQIEQKDKEIADLNLRLAAAESKGLY